MGYYTSYTLTGQDADKVIDWLEENADVSRDYLEGADTMKWYEHDKYIIAAMLATESTSVDLHGEGEEQGDVWGKEYRADAIDPKVIRVSRFKYKLVRDESIAELAELEGER